MMIVLAELCYVVLLEKPGRGNETSPVCGQSRVLVTNRVPSLRTRSDRSYIQLHRKHDPSKHNICITFVQRRPNVEDVGPTLYKCYTNVMCLLG